MIKAVIEYHRVGMTGSFSLEGFIDAATAGDLFEIYDGIAEAFLVPPPATLKEYLSEGINSLNPGAYTKQLTFEEALAELRAGKAARACFARMLDDPDFVD